MRIDQKITAAIFAMGMMILPSNLAYAQSAPDKYNLNLMEALGAAYEEIRQNYVTTVDDEELIRAAIEGMVGTLDPHSAYLPPESLKALNTSSRGEFGGLGIEVALSKEGHVLVISPIDDTPASRAGMLANDQITALDDDPVLGKTLREAVELMRGKVGEPLKLTILREGEDPFDVTLVRDHILLRSVRSEIFDNVGYVRISTFNLKTAIAMNDLIAEMNRETDGKLIGFILDMRNNPGGVLGAAIDVSDSFLQHGEIVSTRGREVQDIIRYQAKPGDIIDDKPLIVLINEGSASASEIVAGALKDHRRAVIMGKKSFGKGSVQTILPLPHQEGGLKLTSRLYYTPSGQSIHEKGIIPDIVVEPQAPAKPDAPDTTTDKSTTQADEQTTLDIEEEPKDEAGKLTARVRAQDYQIDRAIHLIKATDIFLNKD